MAELGALEAMAVLGALEAMAELGDLEAMAGHFRGPGLGPLGPAPTAGTLSTPPPKKFPWGIKGVSGALRGWTDTETGQDTLEQDSPQEQEALLGWLGGWDFFWAWLGVRGPHRVPQRPPPFQRQGGRRLEWPPWPQQEEPPAPDESPRTRQGYLKCSCGHNKTNTALLAVCGQDPRG